MLTLHNLKKTRVKKIKRLGRGNASRGNYSGRGMKGQKSRSGVGGLKRMGVKAWLMKVPKKRGFSSPIKPKANVTLEQLDKAFSSGEKVDIFRLRESGLIDNHKLGVKVIATGKITKPLTIKVHALSAKAKAAIEQAGGQVELIGKTGEKKNK